MENVEIGGGDEDLQRVKEGDLGAFELLMRRNNQGQFEGRAKFSTWLLKIGVNEVNAARTARGPVARVRSRCRHAQTVHG